MHFTYAISVCDHANQYCPRLFPDKYLHWSFEDPAAFEGGDEEKLEFREVRDQINQRI